MNEAIILKAIEGGWCNDNGYQFDGMDLLAREIYFQSMVGGELHNHTVVYPDALLDRTFWQALGKALGWKPFNSPLDEMLTWQYEWHRFIDHLASGKPADDFFKELLENSKAEGKEALSKATDGEYS